MIFNDKQSWTGTTIFMSSLFWSLALAHVGSVYFLIGGDFYARAIGHVLLAVVISIIIVWVSTRWSSARNATREHIWRYGLGTFFLLAPISQFILSYSNHYQYYAAHILGVIGSCVFIFSSYQIVLKGRDEPMGSSNLIATSPKIQKLYSDQSEVLILKDSDVVEGNDKIYTIEQRLEKLQSLQKRGLINDQEAAQKRQSILDEF